MKILLEFWQADGVFFDDQLLPTRRVILYTQAAIALHNFLRTEESLVYCPPGFVDSEDGCGNVIEGGWRQDEVGNTGFQCISHAGSNRYGINIHHRYNVITFTIIFRF